MLVFEERGKPEYPEKNLSEQKREPTTNSAHLWRRVCELNPGHIGGRLALSPLRHPCSPNQLVEHCTSIAGVMSSNSVQAWIFQAFISHWAVCITAMSNHVLMFSCYNLLLLDERLMLLLQCKTLPARKKSLWRRRQAAICLRVESYALTRLCCKCDPNLPWNWIVYELLQSLGPSSSQMDCLWSAFVWNVHHQKWCVSRSAHDWPMVP